MDSTNADRTIHNNKPENIIGDIEKGTCMFTDAAIWGDRNVIKKQAQILKYEDYSRNPVYVECENKHDTSNNGGNWNHFKIIQKIPY